MEKDIFRFERAMKASDPQWILNVSDVHYDSVDCDRKLLKRHFDQAKERNAWIIITGDWFDAMGTKKDPRSLPNDIRPEYNKVGGSYIDLIVKDSYDFLKPYKENIKLITEGNHETNITRRQQIDPLNYLIELLNQGEETVQLGRYEGAIVFKFQRSKDSNRGTSSWYYHHGYGGSAKRSKGILEADIMVSQHQWADILTSGHTHQKWDYLHTTKHLNILTDSWETRETTILKTGSYKKRSGWAVEKGFNEPTLGGYWVKYFWKKTNTGYKLRYKVEKAGLYD